MSMKKINWTTTVFFILTPIFGVAGTLAVLLTHGFNRATLILSLFYIIATGLSITAGYHRLFAHGAYEARAWVKWFYILFGAAAFQGSVLEWSTDHRDHHRYTDQEQDPYSIKKGFWFAHIGWIFYLDSAKRDFKNIEDLSKDPLLRWQHKYYTAIAIFMCFLLPLFLGMLWKDPWGGLFIAGALRVSINHHLTFFINSFCHLLGKRTYSTLSARDNWILSLFTYGEGYHNFHHQFASDYRNGVCWYHFDPSKWLIWLLHKIKSASHLKRVDHELIQKCRVQAEHQELNRVKDICPHRKEELVKPIAEKIHQLYAQLVRLRRELSHFKINKVLIKAQDRIHLKECKHKILQCKREFYFTLKQWSKIKKILLAKSIL